MFVKPANYDTTTNWSIDLLSIIFVILLIINHALFSRTLMFHDKVELSFFVLIMCCCIAGCSIFMLNKFHEPYNFVCLFCPWARGYIMAPTTVWNQRLWKIDICSLVRRMECWRPRYWTSGTCELEVNSGKKADQRQSFWRLFRNFMTVVSSCVFMCYMLC